MSDPKKKVDLTNKLNSGRHYFSIGEVVEICNVPDYTLRYWECVFWQLNPVRRGNRRFYRKSEIDLILRIRDLIYFEGFSTKGVAKQLARHAVAMRNA